VEGNTASTFTQLADDQPLQLAKGVELLSGPGNVPLLYVESHQKYLRLSQEGAKIVGLLTENKNITSAIIVKQLAERYPTTEAAISARTFRFLGELQRANALVQPEASHWLEIASATPTDSVLRISSWPLLRLPLWKPNRPLATNALKIIAKHPRIFKVALILWLVVAFLSLLFLLPTALTGTIQPAHLNYPVILICFLTQIIIHEFCHALTCSYYGIKIREIGFGLLYYLLPVGYTDLTDSYRLQKFSQRAWVALAGPFLDFSALTVSTYVAVALNGGQHVTLHALLLLQLNVLAFDFLPLLPSDGYRALEAFCGGLNFRRHALTFLLHYVLRKPLPSSLAQLPLPKRLGYLAYGIVAFGYIALVGLLLLSIIFNQLITGLNMRGL
jgi:putative peptide zinc metalloprotease protein